MVFVSGLAEKEAENNDFTGSSKSQTGQPLHRDGYGLPAISHIASGLKRPRASRAKSETDFRGTYALF
jgi:hypothetical protein